jgi:hypothetical protein
MKKSSFVFRSHILNAVLCSVVAFGLAACGGGEAASSGAASTSSTPPTASVTSPGTIPPTTPPPGNTSPPPPISAPVQPITAGVATLDWMPPTENSDGSMLTDLAGYNVYYGTSPTSLTEKVKVANPGLSAYTVSNLTSGTWYFAVTSYSSSGVESTRSGTISTTI